MSTAVKKQALSLVDSLTFLTSFNKTFRAWSRDEFLDFVNDNAWMTGNLLPVNDEKAVCVPFPIKTPECRMTSVGLNTLVNSFGVFRSIDGVTGGNQGVVAHAVALQCRRRSFHIDLDLNVFGLLPQSSELALPLIDWVYRHQAGALKVRGNRNRFTLIFDASPELQNRFSEITSSGRKFVIKDTVNGAIELGWGTTNNTLFGKHPDAGMYQQIAPKGGKLEPLSLEAYEDFLEVAQPLALASAYDTDVEAGQGRVALEDAPEALFPLRKIIELHRQLIVSKGGTYKPPTLSIYEYLNPQVKKILEGKAIFHGKGSGYEEVSGVQPIHSGVRHSTFLNVGSNVKEVMAIFDTVGILYDPDEPQQIYEMLWEHTDPGSGAKHFGNRAAEAAFAGFPYIIPKYTYLISSVKKITLAVGGALKATYPKSSRKKKGVVVSSELRDQLQAVSKAVRSLSDDQRSNKKHHSKYKNLEHQAEAAQLLEDGVITSEEAAIALPAAQINADFVSSGANPFADIAEDETDETDNGSAGEPKQDATTTEDKTKGEYVEDDLIEDLDVLMDDLEKEAQDDPECEVYIDENVAEEFEQRAKDERELDARVHNDIYESIHPRLRTLVKANAGDTVGVSYSFQATLCAATMPIFGYAKVTNANRDGKGFSTLISPFALMLAASAVGKSQHLNVFDTLKYAIATGFSHVPSTELKEFKSAYCDKNGNFQDPTDGDPTAALSLTPGSGDDNDPDIVEYVQDSKMQLHRLSTYFDKQRAVPANFLKGDYGVFLDTATEAGVRDIFLDQEIAGAVKEITGDIGTTVSPRPIGIISDELNDLFSKVHDNRNSTFSAAFACKRKEGAPAIYKTATQRSGFTPRAGFSISGAMTVSDALNYIRTEINVTTTGFIPRFNLNILKSKDEIIDRTEVYPEIDSTNNDAVLSMYLAAYGVVTRMMGDNPLWEKEALDKAKLFPRISLSGNVDIYNNKPAQTKLIDARNDVLAWRDRMIVKFTSLREKDFVTSFANKSWQEMAIYAGASCISNQLLDYTFDLIDKCGKNTESLLALMTDNGTNDNVSPKFIGFFRRQMQDRYSITGYTPYEWRDTVSVEEVDTGVKMFMHSLYTLEYLMGQLSMHVIDDDESRAKLRHRQGMIKQSGDKTFVLEGQVKAMFDMLVKLLSDDEVIKNGFTFSQNLARNCRPVRRLGKDDDTVTRIFDMLIAEKIVQAPRTTKAATDKYEFMPKISSSNILRVRKLVLESIYEVGNERM